MAILKSVKIQDFWGDRDVEIDFEENVNFLIGPNGSGKTTIINTVAAALSADFHALDQLPFRTIDLALTDTTDRRKKPSIQIRKRSRKSGPFTSLDYKIRETANSPAQTLSLDELEEELLLRSGARFSSRRSALFRHQNDLREIVYRLIPSTWLSVHRSVSENDADDRNTFESPVDKKLFEVHRSLQSYFGQLEKQSKERIDQFQTLMFLALLKKSSPHMLYALEDYTTDQMALIDIFKSLSVREEQFESEINEHFDSYGAARDKIREESGPVGFDVAEPIINQTKLHSIVLQWQDLTRSQDELFAPRDRFLETFNSLLQRKELSLNDSNEIVVTTQSGKTFGPDQLSSGEKQLLIIFGEALLQRRQPRVYIADEPELSLHLSWQESLVENLLSLNSEAQIIFATHSPDIVSRYQDCVINMEKILN